MSAPTRPGPLTERRRKTHGEWPRTARIAQGLKERLREELAVRQRPALNDAQVEALDMILVKIARIVSGDADHPDHWDDIAGYALLGREGAE